MPQLNSEQEVWEVFPEHPQYMVSNLGRVKGPKGFLSPNDGGRGYLRFSIPFKGGKKTIHVHQQVCMLFHGEAPEGKPFALHNNHIKKDCRASNLHWGSCQDNVDERQEAGHTNTKLDWDKVREIRSRHKAGESQGKLGLTFGITQQYVGKLISERTWKEATNASA